MNLLEKLREITELVRKGEKELERDEILELCDIIRYIPDKNKTQVYDYLIHNDPILAQRLEKETLNWISDIIQNITQVSSDEGSQYVRPKHVH